MKNKGKKVKMAVVRAYPRISEFIFYKEFHKTNIKLIGNSAKINNYFQKYKAPLAYASGIFSTRFAGAKSTEAEISSHSSTSLRSRFSAKVDEDGIESVYLPVKPKYLIDPVKLLDGEENSRSWVSFENLEASLKDCDLINISDIFYFYSRECARLAKKYNKPLISVVWETYPNHPSRFIPPYANIIRETVEEVDLYILRCFKALEFTDAIGVPREKTKVIYKGVDFPFFDIGKERKSRSEPMNILYLGQMIESKGIKDLIGAFANLIRKGLKVELTLGGIGHLEKYVKDMAKIYPIKYLGFVDYSKLPEVYGKADIFCSPSKDNKILGVKIWEECFSYTLMEAQACGLPIVATKCGGIPEEVGEGNFLVDQGGVDSLTLALMKFIENRALREKVGRANWLKAEKYFDIKKQAEKTEDAILSLV